jgi:GNAT superfamily N-acetyltransferase
MTDLDAPLPAGYRIVPARTTYMEMLRNEAPEVPTVPAGFCVERWRDPPLDEYRALFSAVGGDWGWTGRLLLSDAELSAALGDPAVEIYRLSDTSGVAGFAELERGPEGDVEIVYFGLAPDYIGRGLGGALMRWAIHAAWQGEAAKESVPTRRLWLHTCDFDSDTAIGFYRHCGFEVFDERVQMEPYPEDFLARVGR